MPSLGDLRSRWAAIALETRDRWLAVVVTLATLVPGLAVVGAQFGDLPRRDGGLVAILLTLGVTLPLAVRTRWPAGGLAVTGICFAAYEVLAYRTTVGSLAVYLMLYSAGAHEERFRRASAVVGSSVYLISAVLLTLRGSPMSLLDYAIYLLVLVVFWLLGSQVRRRRREEAERRRLTALAAASEERARLARELHDVVSHHVTAIVVQADAARYLTASPERVTEVLAAITGSGRTALTELRFLLGVLEATSARTPGLAALRDLVDQSGTVVDLVEEGERQALPAETELTAYRIVQEALTNAAKYAARSPASVRIRYAPTQLEVEIITAGPVTQAGILGSGGRGLTGLRDRVQALGGQFEGGPSPSGFRVCAAIPVRSQV